VSCAIRVTITVPAVSRPLMSEASIKKGSPTISVTTIKVSPHHFPHRDAMLAIMTWMRHVPVPEAKAFTIMVRLMVTDWRHVLCFTCLQNVWACHQAIDLDSHQLVFTFDDQLSTPVWLHTDRVSIRIRRPRPPVSVPSIQKRPLAIRIPTIGEGASHKAARKPDPLSRGWVGHMPIPPNNLATPVCIAWVIAHRSETLCMTSFVDVRTLHFALDRHPCQYEGPPLVTSLE
jgi:hypothetical protein